LFLLAAAFAALGFILVLLVRVSSLLQNALIITQTIIITLNLIVQIKTPEQLLQLLARISATRGPCSFKLAQIRVLRSLTSNFFG
jgi:hypothetical protein